MNNEDKSAENNILLIQLGKQITSHIAEQQNENQRLHTRVDSVQTEMRAGIEQIKSSLAASGKLSGSHIAVLISLLVMIGGIVQTYISIRLGNITPLIDVNTAAQVAAKAELNQMKKDIVEARLESARSMATTIENLRWIEREVTGKKGSTQ